METKLTMDIILDRLIEWRDNIQCDLNGDTMPVEDRNKYRRQDIELSKAIGILSAIGENNNIHK